MTQPAENETVLALFKECDALLQGHFKRGDTIFADVENGQIIFLKEMAREKVVA
jgi:hypothetical protein